MLQHCTYGCPNETTIIRSLARYDSENNAERVDKIQIFRLRKMAFVELGGIYKRGCRCGPSERQRAKAGGGERSRLLLGRLNMNISLECRGSRGCLSCSFFPIVGLERVVCSSSLKSDGIKLGCRRDRRSCIRARFGAHECQEDLAACHTCYCLRYLLPTLLAATSLNYICIYRHM